MTVHTYCVLYSVLSAVLYCTVLYCTVYCTVLYFTTVQIYCTLCTVYGTVYCVLYTVYCILTVCCTLLCITQRGANPAGNPPPPPPLCPPPSPLLYNMAVVLCDLYFCAGSLNFSTFNAALTYTRLMGVGVAVTLKYVSELELSPWAYISSL